MAVDVILGLQWGDEGKGKIVDYLAGNYDMVCRFQGGPNAGHTIKIGKDKYVLHTIPSGVFREKSLNLVGNGVVIDPITFCKELSNLDAAGIPYRDRLFLAKKAHLILPTHRYLDAGSEASKGKSKIGSTLKGIGPTYMDKTGRNGLRLGDLALSGFREKYNGLKEKHLRLIKLHPDTDFDLETEENKWFEAIEELRKLNFVDGEYFVNDALSEGKRVLAEGAQGSMLDIDFGTYPFVTSSNTVTSGVCNGLGIAPSQINRVYGITKAYCTRVGSGPFPTELFDETGEKLSRIGKEFGATTGRPRRCGWIDLPQLNYTIMVNGVTDIVITKLDVLDDFESISYCDQYQIDDQFTKKMPYDLCNINLKPVYQNVEGWNESLDNVVTYEGLPENAKIYLDTLQSKLKTNITMVSTGPERRKILEK